MKTSLKNRLGILSNRLAIIPSRPVTGLRSRSQVALKFGHFTSQLGRDDKKMSKNA